MLKQVVPKLDVKELDTDGEVAPHQRAQAGVDAHPVEPFHRVSNVRLGLGGDTQVDPLQERLGPLLGAFAVG